MHLSSEEADFFFRSGRVVTVRKGQSVDIKKVNSLNIVIDGIFEIETIANRDIVYLSPGSFFGFLPFVENRKKGNVKALVDSSIFVVAEEDLYKLFLKSHKALRGYIKTAQSMNFEISDSGRRYFDLKGKVITVYSRERGAGKTVLSSLLGLSLSSEKTIILDLSYDGRSLFDLFNQRITVPLSEKDKGEKGAETLIGDRIVRVNDNLHLLNISFSSRIKVDPGILDPLLFILLRDYSYIIADLSGSDDELREKIFSKTDYIFAIANSKNGTEELHPVLDRELKEGQRVFYVRNDHVSSGGGSFYGGLTLERLGDLQQWGDVAPLERFIETGKFNLFTDAAAARSRALVLQSAQHDSILLASLLLEISRDGKYFDYIYSSSYSYFLVAMMLLSDDADELRGRMRRFFSPVQFKKNFEITFPENYIFKSSGALKYASELAGSKRAEMFHTLPLASINSDGEQRIFSTGSLNRLMAACLVSEPLFETVEIAETDCSSGYPADCVHPSHLLRMEVSEVFNISVNNSVEFTSFDEKYNSFLTECLGRSDKQRVSKPEYMEQSKNLILEVNENEFKFDKISESTMKLSQLLIARII